MIVRQKKLVFEPFDFIMTWKPSQTLTRKCRRLLPSFNFPNYTDNCERQAMSWDETHVKVFKKILVGLITVRCTPKSLIALILSVASIHFVYLLLFKMHKHTHNTHAILPDEFNSSACMTVCIIPVPSEL